MSRTATSEVQRWLDEAGAAMGGDPKRRREALLELETTIWERLDDLGDGDPSEDDVRFVLAALGDPAEMGSSFLPAPPLVAGHHTRAFYLHTASVFAVHFLFVVGATLAQAPFGVAPLRVEPITDPGSVLQLVGRLLGTLVFDAGLVLCSYVAFRRIRRMVRFPRADVAVRPVRHRCFQTAAFFLLVLVLFNFFRDSLFAIYVTTDDGILGYPLTGQGFLDNMALLNIWLGLAVVREVLYGVFGERRGTLGLDLANGALGLYALLRIVATRQLIYLSGTRELLGPQAEAVSGFLNATFGILALVAAAVTAAGLVRRLFRLALIRG